MDVAFATTHVAQRCVALTASLDILRFSGTLLRFAPRLGPKMWTLELSFVLLSSISVRISAQTGCMLANQECSYVKIYWRLDDRVNARSDFKFHRARMVMEMCWLSRCHEGPQEVYVYSEAWLMLNCFDWMYLRKLVDLELLGKRFLPPTTVKWLKNLWLGPFKETLGVSSRVSI